MEAVYEALNIFFIVFHSCLIIFILFGWIWKITRRANLISLLLTAFSWIVLGIWYGIGYCPCTDWHWQIRRKLGYFDMPYSYIKFLIDTITGLDADARLVNIMTAALFSLALICSVWVNFRDYRIKAGTSF